MLFYRCFYRVILNRSTNKMGQVSKIIAKVIGTVPESEMEGVHLDYSKPHWELSGAQEFPTLFKELENFLPPDSVLYFEDGSPSGELLKFLESSSIPEQLHVAYGTAWPRPKIFHIPATKENLEKLTDLTEHCATPELAIHFHVYCNGEVLIEWHDAFDNPMYVSQYFSKDQIKSLCISLSMNYKENVEQII